MGFVPIRVFEELTAHVENGVMSIDVPSDVEDTYFLERQWLEDNPRVEAQAILEGDGGCRVFISGLRKDCRMKIKRVTINVTAQGFVTVATQGVKNSRRMLHLGGCNATPVGPDATHLGPVAVLQL